ncbi:innate immunity activator b isoform X2 [Denticeps clupeoides]|uniref:innate immunity activator b isoform X2 n=1 Tax=Denticeps clupeoides TaxID=299321 RepID=UPI0010A319B3|nr:innate immunity activator protein isoform X2 [Denticeps clupeoides]
MGSPLVRRINKDRLIYLLVAESRCWGGSSARRCPASWPRPPYAPPSLPPTPTHSVWLRCGFKKKKKKLTESAAEIFLWLRPEGRGPRDVSPPSLGTLIPSKWNCKSYKFLSLATKNVTLPSSMEVKEEISDTDSGIILHSGPDSPGTVIKDVSTHTRAVKLKLQSLEDRLELCLLELKKLCIREAELTGHLSNDYPLLPGEKRPHVRRRIGAAFKLDEQSLLQKTEDPELRSLEAELALQQQIHVAARRLCQEEHLCKAVRRSRQQQCTRDEKKLKALQEAVFQLRLQHGRSSPHPAIIVQREQGTSDDSSLSDSAVLEEEEMASQSSQPSQEPPPPVSNPPPQSPCQAAERRLPPQSLEGLQPSFNSSFNSSFSSTLSITPEYERTPIQNSPWSESSLDQPYEKPKKSRSSSTKSSPAVTPTLLPLEACLGNAGMSLQIPSQLALRHTQSSSAPSTPEMHLRRGLSLRIPSSEPQYEQDLERGPSRLPQRRLTELTVPPEYSVLRLNLGNPLCHSSSEDSNSEHSASSYASSPCREVPVELPRHCHSPCTHQYPPHNDLQTPQTYSNFYKNPQHSTSPHFYKGCSDNSRGYPLDADCGRLYISQAPPPSPVSRHEYWYDEIPPYHFRVPKPLPVHVRLSRAPSLREYPHHPSRGLPRHVVSEELKSWHQRNQFQSPRPRSLDRQRQGIVRVRSVANRDSPLSQQYWHQEEASHGRVIQVAVDGKPVKWLTEEDSEIVSQV